MKKHHDHGGLAQDLVLLEKMAHRRQVLRLLGAASLIPIELRRHDRHRGGHSAHGGLVASLTIGIQA